MTDQRPDIHDPGFQESPRESAKKEGLVEQAKGKARSQVETRANRSAKHLEPFAATLHTAAQQLDEQGEGWAANYARQAAAQLDRATGYLRDEDAPAMMADLENTARAHPATFVGAAFASGVALGRFLRSSRPKADNAPAESEATPYYEAGENMSPYQEGRA